jgi:hypothetical protein
MSFIKDAISDVTDLANAVGGLGTVKEQGFSAPNAPGTDVGLPFTKVSYGVSASRPSRRHLINWFVPDMGVVRMYVNPENISYNFKKVIKPQRTKGGYSLQYWGEDLTTVEMNGTTGSSGVEGVNALYEVYRSEQYTFDAVGLTLSSNNAAENVANNLFSSGVSALKGAAVSGVGGVGGAVLGGLIGAALEPPSNGLAPRNLPSLAQNAFTVEMYYMGWVFRGYFNSITIREKTDLMFDYTISFTATQKRGYRTNFLPWHKTPIGGGGDLGNHFEQGFDTSSGNNGYGYDTETGTATSPYYSFNKTYNSR